MFMFALNALKPIDDRQGIFPLMHINNIFNLAVDVIQDNFAYLTKLTLNLKEGSYQPYQKPSNNPLFIDSHSNHPPSIIKQIPLSVSKRISEISSAQRAFSIAAPLHENALNQSNYPSKLKHMPCSNTNNQRKRRHRNIVSFNPPYGKNVRTNLAKNFLKLINKHFPPSNPLHKIFNRNTVKVSYSCMKSCKSVISQHNKSVLLKDGATSTANKSSTCNCRMTKDRMPLAEKMPNKMRSL